MGDTEEKHDVEKDEKEDKHKKEEKKKDGGAEGEKKVKDKKKKKDKKEDGGGEEKKKKNPEDKTDPSKIKLKIEKLDAKIQVLNDKKAELLKLLQAAEKGGANPPETS